LGEGCLQTTLSAVPAIRGSDCFNFHQRHWFCSLCQSSYQAYYAFGTVALAGGCQNSWYTIAGWVQLC